jgi:hypothetical protein
MNALGSERSGRIFLLHNERLWCEQSLPLELNICVYGEMLAIMNLTPLTTTLTLPVWELLYDTLQGVARVFLCGEFKDMAILCVMPMAS